MSDPRLAEWFDAAVELTGAERVRWMDSHCAGEPELRRALEQLLRADEAAGNFLEDPPPLLAAAIASSDPERPRHFGAWRTQRRLGAGGMGEVWLAERVDGAYEQRVAIKQLAYPTPGLMRRFSRERQILAALEHPHIARLLDGGVDADGVPYLAMEYVEGEAITDYARRRSLQLRARISLFLKVCDAVQFAHQNLVVHRDLKPSNILVTPEGVPKLLDFGIARVLANTDDEPATRTATRLLTPDYAAPEQFHGGAVTTAVDVYALGVVLHELLTGSRPRIGGSAGSDAPRVADEPVPPSTRVRKSGGIAGIDHRDLRGDLDRIAMTALATDPARRYPSAAAFAADLRNYLAGRPISAQRDSAWYRTRKFIGRNRYALSAAAVITAVLIGATAVSLNEARIAREQALRAERQGARAEAARDFLAGVFEQANPEENKGEPLDAERLLARGQEKLEAMDDNPALRADLLTLVGSLYWNIGDPEQAEALLEKAVAVTDPVVPEAIRARSLMWLGRIESETHRYDAAIGHERLALEHAARAGDDALGVASRARSILAHALRGKGDLEGAAAILREGLAEDRANLGERSMDVIDDMYLLSWTLVSLGRYPEAAALAQDEVQLATDVFGRQHGLVINGLGIEAQAYGRQGDFAAAEARFREAADIARTVYGPGHRETLIAEGNLLWSIEQQGRVAEGLEARLAMRHRVDAIADTQPAMSAYSSYYLANDYLSLGRFEDAEARAREATAIWKDIHGNDDTADSAGALYLLGNALMYEGRYDEAESTFGKAIRILSPSHSPRLGWSRGALGNVLRLAHRYGEAVEVLRHARNDFLEAGITSGPRYAILLAQLSEGELDAGDATRAEQAATEAVEVARQALPDGNFQLGWPLFALGRAQLALGRSADAEALLRESAAVRTPVYPAADPRLLETEVALIAALRAQDREQEARALDVRARTALESRATPYAGDLLARLDRGAAD